MSSLLAIIEQALLRHARPGQALVVGYSGGIDSTVLLYAVHRLARWPLAAWHVHHGLHPQADAWAAHCQAQAHAWGLPCAVRHVRVARDSGAGLEAAARAARHAALAEAPGDWLLLAHHQGDQAETVLANLLRGAGVLGLAGMSERKGRTLRPLLSVARSELQAFAAAEGLRWIEDDSNRDEHYTRNWLRRCVVPLLAERFPQVEARLAASATHAAEAQELLAELAASDAAARSDATDDTQPAPHFPLTLARLRTLSPSRAANLLRAMLTTAGLQAPPANRLQEFLRQCREARPDRHPQLATAQWTLEARARRVHLYRQGAKTEGHPPT